MDWHWLQNCFHFVRKQGKIDESSGSGKWTVPAAPGVTSQPSPFNFIYKANDFYLYLRDFRRSHLVGFWERMGSGVCIFSIKLYLAWWHSNTKNMHSNMLVEKLLRKIYILFFNMQVKFILSASGGINPSQRKLVTWYCLVKSKLSLEIHLESTNNINGWIKNQ